jgi:type IV pilus assembly protein PilW
MNLNPRHLEAGLTLVELMISITISMLLIFAVGSFYVANKSSYNTEEQLARLQESGRFSNYYLTRELRNAGFQGCSDASAVTINNLIASPAAAYANTNATQGYDGSASGTFSPALSAAITGGPVANSDVIAIHTVSSTSYPLSSSMTTAADALSVTGSTLVAGQVAIIANCGVADVFKVSSGSNGTSILHTATDNTSSSFSVAYDTTVAVVPYQYYAFYVRDTGRVNSQNQPIYALVREDSANNIEEVAEGIERMRVTYMIDTDTTDGPNRSNQTATTVNSANNWGNVTGIQISLLLATNENISKRIQSYFYNGATITPTDRKLRRQWDIFVNLRNGAM